MSEVKKPIKVRAIREGYFENQIKVEGAVFMVSSEQELGSWMERMDGGVNPAEGRHLKVANIVENKSFKALDTSKLLSESKIKAKAEKETAAAHKDAAAKKVDIEVEVEEVAEAEVVLTPAQKAAATRARKAAEKEAATQGLI